MIYGIRTLAPTITPSSRTAVPPRNSPAQLPPVFFTPEDYPRTIPPGQSPPMKYGQGQLPISGSFFRENYPWIIPLWTVTPTKFSIGQLPPGLLPLEHFSLNNSSLNNYPQTTDPQSNSSRRWQRTFAPENCPWIIYRCRSKKVLFTHLSLEILNKFWKKIKQGAVHTTSWRYFILKKSFL